MFDDSRVKGTILDQSGSKRYMEQLSKRELQDIVTILYQDAIEFGYNWDAPGIKAYRMTKLSWITRDLVDTGRRIFDKIMLRLTKHGD